MLDGLLWPWSWTAPTWWCFLWWTHSKYRWSVSFRSEVGRLPAGRKLWWVLRDLAIRAVMGWAIRGWSHSSICSLSCWYPVRCLSHSICTLQKRRLLVFIQRLAGFVLTVADQIEHWFICICCWRGLRWGWVSWRVKSNLLIVDALSFGLDGIEGDDGVFFVELKRIFEVVLHI